MNFKLKVWRQKDGRSPGSFKDYDAKDIPAEASFLEMLDIVNETLVTVDEDPIAFDSDCREGICGTCSLVINGVSHGPGKGTTCQVYMRRFADGGTIWIEPFRMQTDETRLAELDLNQPCGLGNIGARIPHVSNDHF